MKIISGSKSAVLQKAAHELSLLFVSHAHVPVLFMASGGSALRILEQVDVPDSGGNRLALTVLDERIDVGASNFFALSETSFFKKAVAKGAESINPLVGGIDTAEGLAERFAFRIRTWQSAHPEGVIIATFGIGADGHTAGIFPDTKNQQWFSDLFLEAGVSIRGFDAEHRNPYRHRITVTIPFIRTISAGVAYAVGIEKHTAVARVLTGDLISRTPAVVLTSISNLVLCTDYQEGEHDTIR